MSERHRSFMLDSLKARARILKREAIALTLAARDPRTRWYAKALIFLVAAHTFSPIDLVPDFIPVLGYLDDLIIIPVGIWLALRLIPAEVMAEARAVAAAQDVELHAGRIGIVLVVAVWIVTAVGLVYLILS